MSTINTNLLVITGMHLKSFFLFLTNVRCAVIEGSHCCEAASQVLQQYRIGGPVPLAHNPRHVPLPPGSTIFRPVQTWLYYCKNQEMLLDDHILTQLKKVSAQIADHKDLIVPVGWNCFFTSLLDTINQKQEFLKSLYATEDELYKANIPYRQPKNGPTKLYKIRTHLHTFLSNAIFFIDHAKSF